MRLRTCCKPRAVEPAPTGPRRSPGVRRTLWAALMMATLFIPCARAQKAALKSNLLYDAAATVNAGVEVGLAPRWTLDLSGNLNGWDMPGSRKWKHWLAQPEARYWFCDRFSGHFIAVHAHGGQYNWGGWKGWNILGSDLRKLNGNRYQGWFVGGGIAYGYAWALGRHWSMEGEIGVGYAYTEFDRFECEDCGRKVDEDKRHNYFGPTKAALSLIYVF